MTEEGKAESCRTLTQLPELPCALLCVVVVGTGIAIHEVALEHVITRGRPACALFFGS